MNQEDAQRLVTRVLDPFKTHIEVENTRLNKHKSDLRQKKYEIYQKSGLKNDRNVFYKRVYKVLLGPHYKLHARYLIVGVIVHQGDSTSSGHYWAFIRDKTEKWWKCNDSDVTPSTWEEVTKESFGGGSSGYAEGSSAYFLIYQSEAQFEKDELDDDEELGCDQQGNFQS